MNNKIYIFDMAYSCYELRINRKDKELSNNR